MFPGRISVLRDNVLLPVSQPFCLVCSDHRGLRIVMSHAFSALLQDFAHY